MHANTRLHDHTLFTVAFFFFPFSPLNIKSFSVKSHSFSRDGKGPHFKLTYNWIVRTRSGTQEM